MEAAAAADTFFSLLMTHYVWSDCFALRDASFDHGNGTVGHMAGELFKMVTGVNIVHVPRCSEARPAAQISVQVAVPRGTGGSA
jgi:hypothetical protein